MFKQGTPKFELFVECGTEDVPSDGCYHVRFKDEVIYSTEDREEAVGIYEKKRQELIDAGLSPSDYTPPDREELLRKLRAESDIRAMRSEWLSGLSKKSGKGGRGGRGGV